MKKDTCNCTTYAEQISKVACWWFDIKNKTMHWSDEVFKVLGFEGTNISHKRGLFRKLITKEDLHIYKGKIREILRTGKPGECMIRIKKKNAQLAYCFFRAIMVDECGEKKIVGTIQDLTQFVTAQIALEEEKQNAEKMNIAKSYFLAQASHDLHQPMQAIRIFTYNLLNENLSDKQRQIVNKIQSSSNNLETLLDNFLDISKLESGGFQNEAEEFNLGEFLFKLYSEFVEIAEANKIKFKFVNTNTKISIDPILLERILRNLISNAFKYTKNKILLGCKKNKDSVQIKIIDNGHGISENELQYIFDEFFQSHKIKNNRKMGAGLGLHIVKKIALIINAKISVTSKVNKGTCFTLELPIK